MPAPLVHLRLTGRPPVVEFIRDPDVPDDFWYALALYLRPRSSRPSDTRYEVPLESFLGGRGRLRQRCLEAGVGLDVHDDVRELLNRADLERTLLDDHLRGTTVIAQDPKALLAATRFTRNLTEFQLRDLQKLMTLRHGANFSVPGAGKTAVTYALHELLRTESQVSRMLVVAPLSAFDAWEAEAPRCFDDPPELHRFSGHIPANAEVVLVNYQKLRPHYENISSWVAEANTHLVLDEAHRAKGGRAGEWGTACLDLSYLATRRDILTGTPAPQGASDLIAQVEFLWPNQARRILPRDALTTSPPPGAMQQVNQVMQPLFVRTTKGELGLDPPEKWVEQVELSGLQADIYEALRNRYAGTFDLGRADRTTLAQLGQVTIYLLQAATNPALLARRIQGQGAVDFRFPSLEIPPGSALAQLVARYPEHEIPPKFKKLAALLARNAELGRKTLVWSNFPENLLALERRLGRFQPALIYGAIPMAQDAMPGSRTREGELERFREDPDCMVLLANPAATAEGISLHEVCHDAVYLDRTFNAGQFLQSVDRIHRLGLAPGVETRITYLVTTNTIDESVDSRVAQKAERLGEMLNDPGLVAMALPDDDDYGEAIEDVDDIEALFRHLAG